MVHSLYLYIFIASGAPYHLGMVKLSTYLNNITNVYINDAQFPVSWNKVKQIRYFRFE